MNIVNDAENDLDAEIELLKKIGQGDRMSFETLYDRFSRVLFSTAYRVLNNQEAAEDVLQDVFIQIWEKAPLYDPACGKPMTWAITLTRNKAIDRLRSAVRLGRLQDDIEREAQTFEKFDNRSSFGVLASERHVQAEGILPNRALRLRSAASASEAIRKSARSRRELLATHRSGC